MTSRSRGRWREAGDESERGGERGEDQSLLGSNNCLNAHLHQQ